MLKPVALALLLASLLTSVATAQTPAASAAAAAPAAVPAAPVSPAKKALVAKVLLLQQPGIEGMARTMVEQPALQLMQQAGQALQQRVPAEQREAVGREIQADLRKYVDETTPLVRDRAIKLAPSTIGAILEQKMTEEELKQVVQILESPVNKKFQSLSGDMQRAIAEKLVADTQPLVQPKLQAVQQSVGKRLGLTPNAAASAPGK